MIRSTVKITTQGGKEGPQSATSQTPQWATHPHTHTHTHLILSLGHHGLIILDRVLELVFLHVEGMCHIQLPHVMLHGKFGTLTEDSLHLRPRPHAAQKGAHGGHRRKQARVNGNRLGTEKSSH